MRLRHLALATVRDWLGHKDISTTSRYLKSTTAALDAAARSFEPRHTVVAEQSHDAKPWRSIRTKVAHTRGPTNQQRSVSGRRSLD
jgi:hypothetical protein